MAKSTGEGFQAIREEEIIYSGENGSESVVLWKGTIGQRDGRKYFLDEAGKPLNEGFQAYHGKMLKFPDGIKAVMVGQVDGKQYFIDQKTGRKLHEQGYQTIRYDAQRQKTVGQLDGRIYIIEDPANGIPTE